MLLILFVRAEKAMYHDCLIEAQKQDVTWVLFNDVDEYMTILQPNTTLQQLLLPYEDNDAVGAVSAQNWFFGIRGNDNGERIEHFDTSRPRIFVRDFVHRKDAPTSPDQRSKMFVKPNHVTYVGVHRVIIGNETIHLDPTTQLRSTHFKNGGSCSFHIKDTTMRDTYADLLEERISKVYFPPNPSEWYPTRARSC
jgi:hypothetical protein